MSLTLKSRRMLGIIFALTILPTCLPQESVGSPFQIRLTNRVNNILTLQCRLKASSLSTPDAMFFLNESRLENFTELQLGEDHSVSFEITRLLEGYFTCGNDSFMSSPMALIAIPDSMLLHAPSPVYAILGEQVQLHCIISPGQLIQQYSITWERDEIAIYRSRDSPPTLDDRYSVDPSDLSLIIDNVQLEEASAAYQCRLTVADPNTMQTYEYTNLQFYNIQLIVLADPVINGPPTENITIEGHNASFTCSVRGFPAPVIDWQLNGIAVSSDSSANHTRQDGSYLITSDTLLITEVTFEMTGEVRCIGRIPPAVTGDRILDEVNSTTTLIVYSPPSIDRNRLRDSIVAVGENASFECSARGYPSPMITWFLNEARVLPQDTGIEVYERVSQSGPYNVTTSKLQIIPAQKEQNGRVQCLVTTDAEIDLPNDNETVNLVVLGSFDLRVDVTQGGDVLLEVALPTPLSKPVKLIMEYVDLDSLFRRKNVTTNVAYIAKTSFLHLESSSRVPFDRFRVSVRLTSSFIIGPSVEDNIDHAKNRPTLVDPNILKLERNKHIIWGAVFVGVVLGVLVLLLLCCISCLCYKAKITRLVLNSPGKLLETYSEQIRNESNSENFRIELIKKANELAKDIIRYRKERKQSAHITSDGNQERKLSTLCSCVKCFYTKSPTSNQGIEMSRRIEDDCPASGPPPPPTSNGSHPSDSSHQPHSATGNEDEMKVSQGSEASPVDKALDEFMRDLQSIAGTE